MAYNFHQRLNRNRERFEQISEETILFETNDTEFPVLASPILKRPYTIVLTAALTQVERMWWGISVDQLVIPSGTPTPFLPEPGMIIRRELTDRTEVYSIVSEDPDRPCYRYTSANRDRVIICTVLESVEVSEEP